MSDSGLLLMAAKAAGYNVYQSWNGFGRFIGFRMGSLSGEVWNPLENDGDAFRLAAKLHLNIRFVWDGCHDEYDAVFVEKGRIQVEEQIGFGFDENAAIRLAIVRAAAESGKAMP